MSDNPFRSHSFTWGDPMISTNAARDLSGFDFLTQIKNGQLPAAPIASVMNMDLTVVEQGRIVFTGLPAEFHYNPIGTVHGGFAATLLDSALSCAILTTLPAGVGFTTVELHLNYVRPIYALTGKLSCEGKVIHVGRRTATAEGRLTDEDGKLYAHGTTTCMLLTS